MRDHRKVQSLFSLSFDVIARNIGFYCDDDGLKYLTPRIKENLLKRLRNSSSFWKHSNFKYILRVLVHPKLEVIDLTSAYLDDEILQIVQICKELQRIYLISDRTYSFSKQELVNFFKCQKKLQTLQLRNCDIVDDSILECLSENCQNITILDVKGCKEITDTGLNFLGSLPCLQCVTLSKSKITNDGLTKFIKGPSGRMLKELVIDNCVNIDIKGLQEVPKNCPNLEIFIFHNCDFSGDMTMLHLDDNLKKLKQLTWSASW